MKIKIQKQDLERYLKEGYGDQEIADKMGYGYNSIYAARRRYGLPRNNKLGNTFKLTEEQTSIIVGSVLGDGSLKRYSSTANTMFTCEHGQKQNFYNKWKADKLKDLKSVYTEYTRKTVDPRTGKFYSSSVTRTLVNTELNKFYDLFYIDNKQVSQEVLSYVTPLALAVWLMDDGSKKS